MTVGSNIFLFHSYLYAVYRNLGYYETIDAINVARLVDSTSTFQFSWVTLKRTLFNIHLRKVFRFLWTFPTVLAAVLFYAYSVTIADIINLFQCGLNSAKWGSTVAN